MELRIIKGRELTPKMFEFHPVWAEYYEPDDLEDIVSWGYDRESIRSDLFSKHDGSEHAYYAVPIERFPPNNLRFFTLANLFTKSGRLIQGIVMNSGEIMIEIILDSNRSICLSRVSGLASLNKQEILKATSELDLDPLDLEEIYFQTTIVDQDGCAIEGVFRFAKD
jgi:hypothetical protein